MRVGFTPTPSMTNGSRAPMQAATMKNAADEKSPGTLMRAASSCAAGNTVALPPRATTFAPKLCSMRSV